MTINIKSFHRVLDRVVTSISGRQVVIQTLVVQALQHYQEPESNADTSLLGALMNKLGTVGSINCKKLQGYIEKSANVKFVTIKNSAGEKQNVFKKNAGDASPLVTALTYSWFDHENAKHAAKPIDETKFLSATILSFEKKVNEGHVKNRGNAVKLLELMRKTDAEFITAISMAALAKAPAKKAVKKSVKAA